MSTLFGPWGPLQADLSQCTLVPTGSSFPVNLADLIAQIGPTGLVAIINAAIASGAIGTTLPAAANQVWIDNKFLVVS